MSPAYYATAHLQTATLAALAVLSICNLATANPVPQYSLDADHPESFVNNQHSTGHLQPQHLAQTSSQLGAGNAGSPQNKCLSGWMWFNNKCWVATTTRRNWQHAVELCKRMYGDSTLPTIHSEEENEFLKNNVDLRNSPIWLYARHNHQYNKTRWFDKSPVNYTFWDAGQPSEKSSMVCIKTEDSWYMRKTELTNGNTECVSFWEDAKWSTSVGCSVLLPVVCEMKLSTILRYPSTSSANTADANQNGSNPVFGEVSAIASANNLRSQLNTVLLCCMSLLTMCSYLELGGLRKSKPLL